VFKSVIRDSQVHRIEELAAKEGGYFRLTSLIQKRLREAIRGGGAFAPTQNMNTLFELTLDEIEKGLLELDAQKK